MPYAKPFLLDAIYRPPSEHVEWIDNFHEMLEGPFNLTHDIMMLGDFNIDFNKDLSQRWLYVLEHFQLFQLVTTPTRVTERSATIIDHIYTTNLERISNVEVSTESLSDHFQCTFQSC